MTYFIGGNSGLWKIVKMGAVTGQGLDRASHLAVFDDNQTQPIPQGLWRLRGVPSYERYVTRDEKNELTAKSPPLGRAGSTRAAMIPIRKNADWWNLAQDERRAIFEERSSHIKAGLEVVPAVARRLYHCRDLGEPFDFITWFEFSPGDEAAFEGLVLKLRKTEEWKFVDREIDIRLVKNG